VTASQKITSESVANVTASQKITSESVANVTASQKITVSYKHCQTLERHLT
jgi:hypothetical protein